MIIRQAKESDLASIVAFQLAMAMETEKSPTGRTNGCERCCSRFLKIRQKEFIM